MQKILETRIVPVAVIENKDHALHVADALQKGGISIIEVTFRTAAAKDSISAIAREFPDMLVGAGTVLTMDQLNAAHDAGAVFGVAPGLNETIVSAALEKGMSFVPGIMTPSGIEKAMSLGVKMLKFFPAEQAGGIKMLKALSGPYAPSGVTFVPTGGVNVQNAASYLKLPVVAAIGGSWMVDKKLVAEEKWGEIEERTREAVALVPKRKKA